MNDLDLALGDPEAPEVTADAEPDAGTFEPIDPDAAPVEGPVEVSEEMVRGALAAITGMVAMIAQDNPANIDATGARIDPPLWTMTPAELNTIAPPLTAYANRHPAMAAALERGDLFAFAIGAATYLARNLGRIRAAHLADDPEPDTDAPGGFAP